MYKALQIFSRLRCWPIEARSFPLLYLVHHQINTLSLFSVTYGEVHVQFTTGKPMLIEGLSEMFLRFYQSCQSSRTIIFKSCWDTSGFGL
jgi:hypothetical protein